jgi:hypothetical protein
MGTEFIRYRGYRYMLRLRRDFDPDWPSWKADEQHEAIEKGREMFDAAYLDVWERNAELVARVQAFMSKSFPWHRTRNARETLAELARSVRQGAVYVVQQNLPVSGGYIDPARRKASSLNAAEEAAPVTSFKDRYLAQLERMNAERPTWADTNAMMDEVNAEFMTRMAGVSPVIDAMFQAAGWTDKYPDASGVAPSLFGAAQPFEYDDEAPSEDAMELAGIPFDGPAGTWVENAPGKKKQWRMYGRDGAPVVGIDFDDHHGQPNPHAHNWDDNGRDHGWPVSILP